MLDEIQIQKILNERILPHLKKIQLKKDENSLPEYYDGYKEYCRWRNSIRVHAETGVFPEKLLANRSPNVTEKEWEYIKDNYQEITLPLFIDYMATLGRAWSENNWAISYNPEEGLEEYVTSEIVDELGMTLTDYFKEVFAHAKAIDSMGCLVVKPSQVTYVENDGEIVVSGDMINPIPCYYSVDQLVAYEEDEWYMFELRQKSRVEYSGKQVREGKIYEIYDKNTIWRVVQVGKKIEWNFEIEEWYPHNADSIPVTRMKGKPVPRDGKIVWESRFLSAVPLLNEVILDAVYLRAVKNICAFPYRVMTGDVCDGTMTINGGLQHCDGTGYFFNPDSGDRIMCSTCKGEGVRNRMSPYGIMLMRPETPGKESESKTTQPALYYVSPPPEMPELLREEIENNYNTASQMLHLYTSTTEVKGREGITATQKALDMKALYSFVKGDSDQTFGSYDWALAWINYYRNGNWDEDAYSLTKPQTFDFYTEYDYLNQVSEAIKNGLPPFLVHATVFKYIRTLFNNDLTSSNVFDLIMKTDRLLTMTDDEVLIKQTKGLVSSWEVILHDSGISLINDLYMENPNFFEQDIETQIEQLEAKAQELASETQASAPTINDQILALSNGTTGDNQ